MGADTITISENEIRLARQAIYMRLKETTKLAEVHGSVANAIDVLGLHDFIENDVMCRACDRSWVLFYEKLMRKYDVKLAEAG